MALCAILARFTVDFSKETRWSASSPVRVHGPRAPSQSKVSPENSLTARASDVHRMKESFGSQRSDIEAVEDDREHGDGGEECEGNVGRRRNRAQEQANGTGRESFKAKRGQEAGELVDALLEADERVEERTTYG
eukprot:scaffold248419_cov28-Tisochrysis_lutea.AAC.5